MFDYLVPIADTLVIFTIIRFFDTVYEEILAICPVWLESKAEGVVDWESDTKLALVRLPGVYHLL